jgi:hypothetical protein
MQYSKTFDTYEDYKTFAYASAVEAEAGILKAHCTLRK